MDSHQPWTNTCIHQTAKFLGDAVGMFQDALQRVFGPLDWIPIADGAIHRFRVPDDKLGSCNGWYVLHLDGIPSGAFGSWKVEGTHTWSTRKPIDPLEAQLVARRITDARKQRRVEELRRQNDAALQAAQIWTDAHPANANHPYLIRKQIKPYGLRQSGTALLVPLYFDGRLTNLQRIYPDGTKRFLPGGKIKGCYSPIGALKSGKPVFICEGWATGASIRARYSHAVACAMSACNLLAVGRQLQLQYPYLKLIIAGDDDRLSEAEGNGNPGADAARNAAATLRCEMVLPMFPLEAPLTLSDFNDLANWGAHNEH